MEGQWYTYVMNRSNIYNAMRQLKEHMPNHGGLSPAEAVDVLEVMIGESALDTPVRCWLDAMDMCKDWESYQNNYLATGREDYNCADVSTTGGQPGGHFRDASVIGSSRSALRLIQPR